MYFSVIGAAFVSWLTLANSTITGVFDGHPGCTAARFDSPPRLWTLPKAIWPAA